MAGRIKTYPNKDAAISGLNMARAKEQWEAAGLNPETPLDAEAAAEVAIYQARYFITPDGDSGRWHLCANGMSDHGIRMMQIFVDSPISGLDVAKDI